MTIRAKQPGKVTVVVNETVTAHLANSPENHRKYHCSYWGICVKSDWLSVVKSCGVCLLLAWICWLQWSNHQLSVDVLELKNKFSFGSIECQLLKDSHSQIQNIPDDIISNDLDVTEHLVYKRPAKKRRRKRRQRDGKIKEAIDDYMKKNTYVLFLPGTNETERGYFKWNLTYAGTQDEFITCNSNGTFTFKRKGFYLVASQLTVKGINNQQNYGVSYGYKTVLVKDNHDEVLMISEITQDNRGICYTNSENLRRCATDSLSHLVMRYFEKGDKMAIKTYTNTYNVNYYLTEKNSYIGIVALDLWNI